MGSVSPKSTANIRRSNSERFVALRPGKLGCQSSASNSTKTASNTSATLAGSVFLPDVVFWMTWRHVPIGEFAEMWW